MTAIIITGTPGTGKTTIAIKLSSLFGFKHIDSNHIISSKHLSLYFDNKRDCKVIDEKKFASVVERIITDENSLGNSVIIDSHMAQYVNPKFVDYCIVTRCDISKLNLRLKKRGYSKQKISENIECEIMEVCLNEAIENGHEAIIVDTSNIKSADLQIKNIASVIKDNLQKDNLQYKNKSRLISKLKSKIKKSKSGGKK